jgi:hypothetical protein
MLQVEIDQNLAKYFDLMSNKVKNLQFFRFFLGIFRTLEHLRVYLTTEDDIYKVQGFGSAKNQS